MKDAFPRCAVPGSSCRLLQLEAQGLRPVWAVLDAAGTRHFTGEVTLHMPARVSVYFNGGAAYFATREGDSPIDEQLIAMGVLTQDELEAGTVELGSIRHLGRLFDRVPDIDRDRVELAVEIITGEVLGEIADHLVDDVTVASYRHHPSGVVRWTNRPTVVVTQIAAADGHVAIAVPVEADGRFEADEPPITWPAADFDVAMPPAPDLATELVIPDLVIPDLLSADPFAPAVGGITATFGEPTIIWDLPIVAPPRSATVDALPVLDSSVLDSSVLDSSALVMPAFDVDSILLELADADSETFDSETFDSDAFDSDAFASVDDDVRAAVRAALEGIQAATRPDHDLDEHLDGHLDEIAQAMPEMPYLPPAGRAPVADNVGNADNDADNDADNGGDAGSDELPAGGGGLRRLLGGSRTP